MSEIQVALLIFKRIRIEGVTVGAYTPAEAQSRWTQIVERLNRIGARPPVGKVFPMEEVQEAFAYLDKGPWGKVLVKTA
jgi:NADPH:quinone reductase-like Zn-dependent oxidoreductase